MPTARKAPARKKAAAKKKTPVRKSTRQKASTQKATTQTRGRKAVLKLSTATELHSWVCQQFKDATDNVNLDLKSLQVSDSATVQVLAAAFKEASERSMVLTVSNLPDSVMETARNLGMDRHMQAAEETSVAA